MATGRYPAVSAGTSPARWRSRHAAVADESGARPKGHSPILPRNCTLRRSRAKAGNASASFACPLYTAARASAPPGCARHPIAACEPRTRQQYVVTPATRRRGTGPRRTLRLGGELFPNKPRLLLRSHRSRPYKVRIETNCGPYRYSMRSQFDRTARTSEPVRHGEPRGEFAPIFSEDVDISPLRAAGHVPGKYPLGRRAHGFGRLRCSVAGPI